MNRKSSTTIARRVRSLRKRSPWLASLILHCLETRDPRAIAAMRLMLTRMGLQKVC